ncbi:MAG: hypothetical protein EPO01_01355 [Aquabacterium sp.]|nr:MAG: hypothetical protein EPO01_01355 [Aquabacterium sp.]
MEEERWRAHEWIVFWAVSAGLLIAIAILFDPMVHWLDRKIDWPAWVQAVGSVIALAFAVWLPGRDQGRQDLANRKVAVAAATIVIAGLHSARKERDEGYVADFDELAHALAHAAELATSVHIGNMGGHLVGSWARFRVELSRLQGLVQKGLPPDSAERSYVVKHLDDYIQGMEQLFGTLCVS